MLVRETAAGAIELRYRGRLMQWTEIAPPAPPLPPAVRPQLSSPPHRPARPSADHPWRRDTRATDRERALSVPGDPAMTSPWHAAGGVDAQNAPPLLGTPQAGVPHAPTGRPGFSFGRDISISSRRGTFLFRVDKWCERFWRVSRSGVVSGLSVDAMAVGDT